MTLLERIKAKTRPRSKQPCPLAKGTIAIVLTRADTGKAIQGAAAAVNGPTPGDANTDDLGAAIFTERTPGKYTARVTLPPALKGYRITQGQPNGSVAADGTEILMFQAAPIGNLVVEVYDDAGKLIADAAELSSSGPQHVSQKAANGKHTFSNIVAGKYNVSATVPADKYETRTVSKAAIVVPPGGTGHVHLEVKRLINVVTPKIEMEYKVVVLDRKLSAHQDASEKKIVSNDVTFVQLTAAQSTGMPDYTGHGTFEVSPANVDVYIDKECKNLLAGRKITNRDLVSGKFKLYLKAKTKGKFTAKLTLDPSNDPARIHVKGPAHEQMGVVELQMKVHRYEKSDLDIAVHPDVEPYSNYYKELKDKKLPAQKALSDENKVKAGRLLHAQADKSHARAKVVLHKLVANEWPAGTDDYVITLRQQNASGSVKFFDKEWDGTETKAADIKIKVKQLKGNDVELWLEGEATTKKLRDVVVDVGLEREAMAAPHTGDHHPKCNADWARFTVVQVEEVKVAYAAEPGKAVAWRPSSGRFYINYKPDPDGRKVTIEAKLSEPIKGITLHFMLAEDANNMKAANWGLDLTSKWKWKDVKPAVKHKDKDDRKKLLHLSQATDDKGTAKKELILSRFGGDKFHPAVYIDQDPQLAKFVAGHTELGIRKPKVADKPIEVWRRFWAQIVKVDGAAFPGTAAAEGQYERVKAKMKRTADVMVARATVNAMNPQAIYPKYMVYVNGGNSDAVVVSDTNKAQFFTSVVAEADKPVKIPILVCDAQWDPGGTSGAIDSKANATSFPLAMHMGTLVIDPPLQGGKLLVSGDWTAAEPDGHGGWTNKRNGTLADGDVYVDPKRTDLEHARVKVPAGVAPVAGTRIWISDLVVQGANGPYLGEYSPSKKRILAVYDQTTKADMDDFPNTLVHEIGHAFHQIMHKQTEGIPKHPEQKDLGQGNHCRHLKNKCVMYDSGPVAGTLNRYCDVCHPYMQLVDMQQLS